MRITTDLVPTTGEGPGSGSSKTERRASISSLTARTDSTPWGLLLVYPFAFNQQYFLGFVSYLYSLPILILALKAHRDLMRCFERLLRRAGVTLRMSQGFHPKPRMTFPSALAVGIEGTDEVMELELAESCTACYVDKAPRKLERPSDHTPVVAEFDLA